MYKGAEVSNRTMASAAIDMQSMRFTFSPDWFIDGYLAGMDAYHWKVVDGNGDIHLIHKGSVMVSIGGDAPPLDELDADQRTLIEGIAGPFREHLLKTTQRKS